MSITAKAENKDIQRVEFELRTGLMIPIGSYHGGTAQTGAALGMQGRYKFKNTPWNCGLLLELTTARRGFIPLVYKNLDVRQSNRTLTFAATGAYSSHQGSKINPYVGVAISIGINGVVGDNIYPSKCTSLFFSPSIGIECLRHLRLAISSNISRKEYNNLQVSLGAVIGGGRKRK